MNGSYFFTGFGCFRFISTLFSIYAYTLYSFRAVLIGRIIYLP